MITNQASGWSRTAPIQVQQDEFGDGSFGDNQFSVVDPTRYLWSRVKNVLLALAVAFAVPRIAHGDTTTSNLGFTLPTVGVVDPTTPWGTKINGNWTLCDTLCAKKGVDTSSVTANAPLTGTGSAATPLGVDPSSATLQGNTFNAASKLVQLDGSARLPALSGALLTSLTAANISAGSLGAGVIASSVGASVIVNSNLAAGSFTNITGVGTLTAGTISTGVTLQLSNVSYTGTMSGSNVSGGTFGAVNGSALTSLTAANISAGSLGSSVLVSSLTQVTTAATCGSATVSCGVTFNAQGQILSVTSNTISGGGGTAYPLDIKTATNTVGGFVVSASSQDILDTWTASYVTSNTSFNGCLSSAPASSFIDGSSVAIHGLLGITSLTSGSMKCILLRDGAFIHNAPNTRTWATSWGSFGMQTGVATMVPIFMVDHPGSGSHQYCIGCWTTGGTLSIGGGFPEDGGTLFATEVR